ncbi:hypothetical protein EBR96_04850 [bacterium]|nr:hypothetical protein [bacterium]
MEKLTGKTVAQIAYIEIVIATFIWGICGTYVRLIHLPVAYMAGIRMLVPVLFTGAWIMMKSSGIRLYTLWNKYVIIAAIANISRVVCYFIGFSFLPLGNAILIMYTWPIIVSVMAIWILNEPFQPKQLGLGFLALTGVALVQVESLKFNPHHMIAGTLATLGCAISNSIMLLAFQKSPHPAGRPEMVFSQNAFGALLLLPYVLWKFPAIPLYKTAISIGVSVSVGIVGFFLFFSALKRIPTSQGAMLAYLEVLFAMAAAVLIMHESLTPAMLVGGTLILVGSLGAQRIRNSRLIAPETP